MNPTALALPERATKPRNEGLTVVIDNGIPLSYFQDVVASMGSLVDIVKFGWGTSVVSDTLGQKICCLRDHHLDYYFGGTLFEKFLSQDKLEDYIAYCHRYECRFVEISNGTIGLSNAAKARLIKDFTSEFRVFSEVGYKDSKRTLEAAEWIEYIQQDLAAGAERVITEARESGTSGIFQHNGELRTSLIEEILDSGIPSNSIIFEAPNKAAQTYFIRRLGSNVNLANIAMHDIIPLETLRLGLRSDTLLAFDD
ncbi:MAG TPA: phosphosulfolactate synthase [Ktedonobacterales bacterium]|jgi:phosphosulfolactate synthase